jgi:[histone H3]-trimethyl-L-lysine9/36 demethylase
VEDADLYSVNFLHWGAPKIWYCVSPKDKAKFERLAGALHPEQLRQCKGFLRHKDILISPTVLKQFDIKYQVVRGLSPGAGTSVCTPTSRIATSLCSVQCKQNPGEYVVLNAAAYHSGFNCGFNTAEAVNFATEDWIQVSSPGTGGSSAQLLQCAVSCCDSQVAATA